MSSFPTAAAPQRFHRQALVTVAVVAVHAAGLWALQRAVNEPVPPPVVTAELIGVFVAPPAPQPPAAQPTAPAEQPEPVKPQPQPEPPKPKPQPKPVAPKKNLPKAIADPAPAPNAPAGAMDSEPAPTPVPPSPASPAQPASPLPTGPVSPPAGGGEVQLPSSNAAYLNNPRPAYPSVSRRMGEEGRVMLRVLVDANGQPQDIQISQSSGFDRLDKAAVNAVRGWRFAPGTRNGVPQPMHVTVPINFVLE